MRHFRLTPTQGTEATYTYDANGNRSTKALGSLTEHYSYDEADKLTQVTDGTNTLRSYTYDDAGRTTAITEESNTTSFAYDYEGRVTSITYPSSSSDSYGYNGLGARVSQSGTHGSGEMFRNGLRPNSEILSDESATYTRGSSANNGAATKMEHSGAYGVVSQTAVNETVSASRAYSLFGEVVSSSGTWVGNNGFGSRSGWRSGPSGFFESGGELYDPTTGRSLTSGGWSFLHGMYQNKGSEVERGQIERALRELKKRGLFPHVPDEYWKDPNLRDLIHRGLGKWKKTYKKDGNRRNPDLTDEEMEEALGDTLGDGQASFAPTPELGPPAFNGGPQVAPALEHDTGRPTTFVPPSGPDWWKIAEGVGLVACGVVILYLTAGMAAPLTTAALAAGATLIVGGMIVTAHGASPGQAGGGA